MAGPHIAHAFSHTWAFKCLLKQFHSKTKVLKFPDRLDICVLIDLANSVLPVNSIYFQAYEYKNSLLIVRPHSAKNPQQAIIVYISHSNTQNAEKCLDATPVCTLIHSFKNKFK